MSDSIWRRCSSCKTGIDFGQVYWTCSVSTCNRKRTGLAFCSVTCWESHLPFARHRDAWAEEQRAPSAEEWQRQQVADGGGKRRRVAASRGAVASDGADKDVLIVVSKLKKFVREAGEMNTSDRVVHVLSDHLRELSIRAMRVARLEGRKTVLNRDFREVLEGDDD